MRQIELPCSACCGHGTEWSEEAHRYLACDVCRGSGYERLTAAVDLVAYLSGSPSIQEMAARLALLATTADRTAAAALGVNDREGANHHITQAAIYSSLSEALSTYCRRRLRRDEPHAQAVPAPGLRLFRREA